MNIRKRCPFCWSLFYPHPRLGKRQISCGKQECNKKRKKRSQKRWSKKNPLTFRGRYPYLKEWKKQNPDYLKQYRNKHKISPQTQNSNPPEINLNRMINFAFSHLDIVFPKKLINNNYYPLLFIKSSLKELLIFPYRNPPPEEEGIRK